VQNICQRFICSVFLVWQQLLYFKMEDSADLWAAIESFAEDNRRLHQELQDVRSEMIKRDAVLFAITEALFSCNAACQDAGVRLIYRRASDDVTREAIIAMKKFIPGMDVRMLVGKWDDYETRPFDLQQHVHAPSQCIEGEMYHAWITAQAFKADAFEPLIGGNGGWSLVAMHTGAAHFEFE
jgi:hypothetical protein